MQTQFQSPSVRGKSIQYDTVTGDFALHYNGQLIDYAPTYLAGEVKLNQYVYTLLARSSTAEFQSPESGQTDPQPTSDGAKQPPSDPPTVALDTAEEGEPRKPSYQAIANVVGTLRAKLPSTERSKLWRNAINRAFSELAIWDNWSWDGETLHILSRTDSRITYHLSGNGCQCTAFAKGVPCWHRAARTLVEDALNTTRQS